MALSGSEVTDMAWENRSGQRMVTDHQRLLSDFIRDVLGNGMCILWDVYFMGCDLWDVLNVFWIDLGEVH